MRQTCNNHQLEVDGIEKDDEPTKTLTGLDLREDLRQKVTRLERKEEKERLQTSLVVVENNSNLLAIQRELKKTETDLRKSQKELEDIETSMILLKKRKQSALRKKAESELRWRVKTQRQSQTKENMKAARSKLRAIQNELHIVKKDLHLAED